jgi:hypothetical protein
MQVGALSISKAVEGFASVSVVLEELRGIVHRDAQDPDGVRAGTIRLDQARSPEGLAASLGEQSTVGHLATHFVSKPGSESESNLLLGDSSRLDLRDSAPTIRRSWTCSPPRLRDRQTARPPSVAPTPEGNEHEGMGALYPNGELIVGCRR